jgi:sulfur carrier protein ThiS
MAIKFIVRKKEIELDGTTIMVKLALKQLDLSPEAYLLVRDGELLNENDILRDGDVIKVVAVISGGSKPGG